MNFIEEANKVRSDSEEVKKKQLQEFLLQKMSEKSKGKHVSKDLHKIQFEDLEMNDLNTRDKENL
jgi:hypothetical protein